MANNSFWSVFSRRSLVCFIVIISLLFSCILATAKVSVSNYGEVQKNWASKKIKIGNTRGTIFDCNKYPLTNNKKKIIAAVSPTKRTITFISKAIKDEQRESVLKTLESGEPAVCEVDKIIECDGIIYTEIYDTYPNVSAIHTIGYTDDQNKGISGIQKAYDNVLYRETDITVRFACDGKGRVLTGVTPEIVGENSPYNNAVVTTIDVNFQKVAEESAGKLGQGAVVIAEAKTSKIRAIASFPTYDTENIESLLRDPNSPLLNRAISSYNVGSVFKPCVAAAGIEKDLGNYCYRCTGSCKIVDRVFKCHEHQGHGFMTLKNAIANSCNTYFYNFGLKIGKSDILNMASNLNFGKKISLCNGISASKGNLPTEEKLENTAHLANFSIGQGDFLASPVSLLTLYSAIANDGKYYLPSIIESTIQNGKEEKYNIGSPTKVFESDTAEKLKNALSLVITEGTGEKATPKATTAAGKTATAQTGKYENGSEINSSWFCGFFPVDNPKYVIIVFCENTNKQSKTCAEIFANIVDGINK